MAGPPAPGVTVHRGLAIALRDGTPLAADLYRPAGAGSGDRTPVLVSYYPYRKDDIIGSLFHGTRIRLAERGYATLFADMTGTGASAGGYGESFDTGREGDDAAQVIEWAAGQDWCDGNAGAWGVSYGGMTALAAAVQRPAHLRAVIAVYATTDIYRDTIAPGGCPAMLGRYAWAAHMMALGLCPPTWPDDSGQWRRTWQERIGRLAAGPSHAAIWQAHPDRDGYWRDRVVDATAIEVPTMLVGGWADMFKDAMISLHGALAGPKRLVMGPWLHVLPHLSRIEPWDWVSEMADWWDAHLRRRPGADTAPVRFFAAGEGWRQAQVWPPGQAEPLRLFPAGTDLAAARPADAGAREYTGDAGVGVTAGMWDPFGTGNGWPEEQSGDDARSLTFTSAPQSAARLIAGRPEAELWLTRTPGPEALLAVRLAAVGPDGRSGLIASGWCRLPARAPDDPDDPERVDVTLGSAAFALPVGTRLRLSVACADFPRLWPAAVNPAIAVHWGTPGGTSQVLVPAAGLERRGDDPAQLPRPPAGPDPGWVTDSEPVYRLTEDKAAGEVAVTFGASSRLRPPSGADLRLDEQFTARVRPGRPAGAALTAQITVGIRMAGGERIDVEVRGTASRTASLTEGHVRLDGVTMLHHYWTS